MGARRSEGGKETRKQVKNERFEKRMCGNVYKTSKTSELINLTGAGGRNAVRSTHSIYSHWHKQINKTTL